MRVVYGFALHFEMSLEERSNGDGCPSLSSLFRVDAFSLEDAALTQLFTTGDVKTRPGKQGTSTLGVQVPRAPST